MGEMEQEVRQRFRIEQVELTKPVSGSTTPDTSLPEDEEKRKGKLGLFNALRDEISSMTSQSHKNSDISLSEKPIVPHYGLPKLDACCSIHTPLRRRCQIVMVAWHLSAFVFLAVLSIYALSNPFLWFLSIPYTIYYMLDKTPGNGGIVHRGSRWFRSLPVWRFYCEYFPISLVKDSDLPPTYTEKKPLAKETKTSKWSIFNAKSWKPFKRQDNKEVTGPRYIFGYHPHGIGALGAFGAFATEACGWSEKFPGIDVSLMTLVTQFHVPLYREYLMALGISAVSRKNSLKVLEQNHSICIVVGGARESLLSSIGTVDLVLKRRKGFIRLALETGNVSLVPVFGFGETDCYKIVHTSEDSYSRKLQLWIKRNYGFTIPLFYARGLFNYDFGFLPFRKPITVVTGSPIYVKDKIPNPTPEQVDHYHNLYIEELRRLYYVHRLSYGHADVDMQIVG